MKIVRCLHKGKERWAALNKGTLTFLKHEPFSRIEQIREQTSLSKVKLLAPSVPQKIVLVGLNYRDHAREMGMNLPKNPVIFLKPQTAVLSPGGTVPYPAEVKQLDYEAELAVVMGKKARNLPEAKAARCIFGYTCLNDITARDLQKKDGQWTRAKSFDGFCPFGPWIETKLDTSDLKIAAILNSKTVQFSRTSNLIFNVPQLVSFISRIMTLMPGDVISTGTPSGVGPMRPGDRIEVAIEGIGHLINRIGAKKK